MPAVSVIIPTYNRRALVRRAVSSVMEQTFRDWELLVIDDASSDGTSQDFENMQDARIRFLRNERNLGAQASRNRGVGLSRGGFICFLDSDDVWVPVKLALQMEVMGREKEGAGVVYSYCGIMDGATGKTSDWLSPDYEGDIYRDLLAQPFMDFITPMIRRECFDRIGPLDTGIPSYQEWDTFIRIARHYPFRRIPQKLAYYCLHEGAAISRNRRRHSLGYMYVVRKYEGEILRQCGKEALAHHYVICARNSMKEGDLGGMIQNLAHAFSLSPAAFFRDMPAGIGYLSRQVLRNRLPSCDRSGRETA